MGETEVRRVRSGLHDHRIREERLRIHSKSPVLRGGRAMAFALVAATAVSAFGTATASAADKMVVEEPGLKPYAVVDMTIPEPLTAEPGDPARGKKIFIGRKKGNCLTCHSAPIPEEQFHGNVGPDLRGVGDRMTPAEMRLRIVNPTIINPGTQMFAFYHVADLRQVKKEFQGKPLLEAQEIEDVIAYLSALKGDSAGPGPVASDGGGDDGD